MLLDPYQFQETKVLRVVREAPEAVSVQVSMPSGYTFACGQHAVVRVSVAGIKLTRQYSFSSAPSSGELWLTIIKSPGGAISTWFVDEARAGDMVEISKPFTGPLVQENPRGQICMIAGGSGIAPLMSMLRENRFLPSPAPIKLLYSTRTARHCFGDELKALPHESIVVHISDTGRFTPEILKETVADAETVYICGSRSFVQSVRESCLTVLGPQVPIYSEAFTL